MNDTYLEQRHEDNARCVMSNPHIDDNNNEVWTLAIALSSHDIQFGCLLFSAMERI